VKKNFYSLEFTANNTWVCPAGVTQVKLYGCGGGGGGGGGRQMTLNAMQGSAQGGSGADYGIESFSVIPGETYEIIIGAGGIGGATVTPGSRGGTTTFRQQSIPTNKFDFLGGRGGAEARAASGGSSGAILPYGGREFWNQTRRRGEIFVSGSVGAYRFVTSGTLTYIRATPSPVGGVPPHTATLSTIGGCGGSSLGRGGGGDTGAFSPAATGYGSGGGGGLSYPNTGPATSGFNGQPGYLKLFWSK
jgi:hypothetical protein